MMEKSTEVSLESISTKIGDGLHGTPKYDAEGNFYFINGNNLCKGKIIIGENTNKISEIEFNKISKKLTERTILLGINGTIGNIAYYNNENVALGKSACYININSDVSKIYIRYVLEDNHFQNYAQLYATGSTIKNLGLKAIRNYKFNLPPIAIQHKIASILSAYDDLIENNLKRIKLLEEMAQQTYEEWFVRMRYPGYQNAVIDEETDLPEGWEKVKLGDWIKTSSGGTPSKKKEIEFYENGTIPWVRTGELKNFILIDSEIKITESGLKNSSAKLFPKGTVLLAMYGNTIGETTYCDFETSTNQACCGFLVKNNNESYFIHQYLLTNKQHVLSFRMGAAQENISQGIIQNMELIKPNENFLSQFGLVAKSHYDSIINLNNQNQRLKEARDILLPRLMSGMIEV